MSSEPIKRVVKTAVDSAMKKKIIESCRKEAAEQFREIRDAEDVHVEADVDAAKKALSRRVR